MSKLELLAPAGNLSTAIVAFESGADSVYAGLPKFNARERSKNFSFEDFETLLSWSRQRGKKVYLTLNTLMKEHELPEIVELLGKVADLAPDAVIVQDIGLVKIIRDFFPGLEIHGSTQMAIHNSAGIKMAAEMGLTRVILERQVSLEELKIISEDSPLEIEVFGHGALCSSLSGTCLFSSWLGGWSGNRGRCKQPCRRRFFSQDGNGFFFSTKDLYTLDFLSSFEECNVKAIKIEGRMRGEDYVSATVSAYRMLLDAPKHERMSLRGEARRILSQSHGRQWSSGFYEDPTSAEVIDHRNIGSAGTYTGKVVSVARNGFELQTERTIRVFDRLRVQPASGDEGPSFTITKIRSGRDLVTKLRKGETGFIFLDKPVNIDDSVFVIGRSVSERKINVPSNGGNQRRVDLVVDLSATRVSVSLKNFPAHKWEKELALEKARSHPLEAVGVEKEFLKCKSDDYCVNTVEATVEDGLFFVSKELRKCRQEFSEWLFDVLSKERLPRAGAVGMQKFFDFYTQDDSSDCEAEVTDTAEATGTDGKIADTGEKSSPSEDKDSESDAVAYSPVVVVNLPPGKKCPVKNALVCAHIFDDFSEASEVALPDFCSEKDLPELIEAVDKAVESGVKRFRVTSLYGFNLLAKYNDLAITAGYPFPVTNSFTYRLLEEFGVSKATIWVELDEYGVKDLIDEVSGRLEVYTFGRPHLLTTRVDVPVRGTISDSRGGEFFVIRKDGLSRIYPKQALTLPEQDGCDVYVDLSHADWSEDGESRFNYDNDWL